MPSAKSPELRRSAFDLVAGGEAGAQVAHNLGIGELGLRRWMAADDVYTGETEGVTSAKERELIELRRKNEVLEMEAGSRGC
ncbi:hypothetical protein DVJ78_16255 [Humibacter sp. BT305]|nr:hypothetical protein DVJ78_16255 [Humibacter sp. BT305]